jgi:hypothetical protein
MTMDKPAPKKIGRGRLPISDEDQKKREQAHKAGKMVSALAHAGKIRAASNALNDAVSEFLTSGDRQGRGKESPLARAALVVLSKCVEFNRVPPRRLLSAFRTILDVEPDDTERKIDAVYYIVENEKVTISKLARVGKISRKTARGMMKPGSEFLRSVQAVKERNSETAIAREKQAWANSKAEVARTESLREIVRTNGSQNESHEAAMPQLTETGPID